MKQSGKRSQRSPDLRYQRQYIHRSRSRKYLGRASIGEMFSKNTRPTRTSSRTGTYPNSKACVIGVPGNKWLYSISCITLYSCWGCRLETYCPRVRHQYRPDRQQPRVWNHLENRPGWAQDLVRTMRNREKHLVFQPHRGAFQKRH